MEVTSVDFEGTTCHFPEDITLQTKYQFADLDIPTILRPAEEGIWRQ
jgi:hypothetical protein